MISRKWGIMLLCGYAAFVRAQTYSNQNFLYGIDAVVDNNIYGAGVSFYDFDGDDWDDLTFVLDNEIKFYRNNNGVCEEIDLGVEVDDNAKHVTWVDFDNDGDKDLFITQYFNQNKLYRNEGNMEMVDISLSSGLGGVSATHFGSCWGDYDLDGDLDVYVCNYIFVYVEADAYNYWDKLYRNDGNGVFTDVSVASGISDGINSTFQAVWIDYNQDLWPDLYTINDKAFANFLYHNNGDGTFTEIGEQAAVAIPDVDAMTASGADMNNDGWEDMFVTNTSIGDCSMLKNNGDGSYSDIATTSGLALNILAWGGNWFDFDLDMDQDLYVCEYFPSFPETPNKFMRNLGNQTFSNVNTNVFPFDFSNSYSCASGDWDHNGYPDLAVSNYAPQNANFWKSAGGNMNYLKISVEGTISNRDAIGTRIVVWVNGIRQMRYTRCGENYLGQDSDDEIFGLGLHTAVDSVQFFWPGGLQETIYDIESNQHIHVVEGSIFQAVISASPHAWLCGGDSILLDAGVYESYLWDDGSTGQFRYVFEPGEYEVTVTSELGVTDAAIIEIVTAEIPETLVSSESATCHGSADGSAEVFTDDDGTTFTWFDNSTGDSHSGLNAGLYECTVLYSNGCEVTYEAEVSQPDSIEVLVEVSSPSCYGFNDGSANMLVTGGNAPYEIHWDDLDSVSLYAGTYELLITDSLDCSAYFGFTVLQPDEMIVNEVVDCTDGYLNVHLNVSGGTSPYLYEWSNGSQATDVLGLPADTAISVIITDDHGCFVVLDDLSCELGIETTNPLKIVVYPNPVSKDIQILNAGDSKLQIRNNRGSVIDEFELQGEDSFTVSVIGWSPGIYLFQFSSDGRVTTLKVLINCE